MILYSMLHMMRFATVILAGTLLCGASPREAFLKMIDRPRVPLAAEVKSIGEVQGFEQYHFTYASDASQVVPGILIKPKSRAKLPVVIALHGTGGNKEGEAGLLKELAGRGFLA